MRIVTYKTAFYTFYLPAATAMRLAGITDEKVGSTVHVDPGLTVAS